MFDLKKFLDDTGRNLGSFGNDVAKNVQKVVAPQPASTAKPQQRQQIYGFGNAAVDVGKVGNNVFNFGRDVLGNVSNAAKPFVDPLIDTANKAANTAAYIPQAVSVLAKENIGGLSPQEKQQGRQDLANTLQRSFVSPEIATNRATPVDFAKGIAQAGVETSNLLPAKGAVTGLANGLSKQAVATALLSNAKQAGVLGTANIANDIAQGREVTPTTLAANYVAPLALGAGSEIAGGAIKTGLKTALVGRTPKAPTNLNTAELAAANRMRQANQGLVATQDITPEESILYNQAQTKLGQQPGTVDGHEAVMQAVDANRGYETRLANQPTMLQGANNIARRFIPGASLKSENSNDVIAQIRAKMQADGVNGNEAAKSLGLTKDYESAMRQEMAKAYRENTGPIMPSNDLPIVGRALPNEKANVENIQSIQPETLPRQTLPTEQVQAPLPASTQPGKSMDQLSDGSGNSYVNTTTSVTNSQGKASKFASRTAPNSGNLSPELAQKVRESAPDYDPATNQGSLENSVTLLVDKGVDGSADDVIRKLDDKGAANNAQTVSDSIATATALDLRGDEVSLRRASEIYDKLSSRLTEAGQTVQAAKLINRRTGKGLVFDAQRQLKNAGIETTPEIRKELNQFATRFDNIDTKLTGQARDEAKGRLVAEIQKSINKRIPTDLTDKLVGTWKAGLLTGIRTTTGGALSNAIFRGLREVSRPGAVAADMAASAFTGKRSVALTAKGAWDGTKEGLQKGIKSLQTGIDERSFSADGKYIDREINFGDSPAGKVMGTYVNGVFRVMGAADRPFYYSQFRNSLAEAAVVEAKNLGLKGKAFDDYVENGLKNPTVEATQQATDIAEQAVLANDTFLSNAANKLRQAADTMKNPAARAASKATLGVLAPFTKVPSAFLTRVIDFTPIGAIKEVVQQAASGKLDQAKLVQAISEAGTGTGVIYLGSELANNDLLSGNYPNDAKEQARWKAEGITPNSVRIGDKWYSLNYAGPIGALMNVGKAITDSAKESGDPTTAISAGVGQLASGTLDQSFLSGVSGALDAVQDPKRYAENFVRSQAGSVVPTILNDIGNATDPIQRQASTPTDAIKGRIPGVRTTLPEKTDSFGNVLKQANDNQLGRLVDPFRPSNSIENDLTKELSRLNKAGEGIYPTTDKSIKIGGETIKLTPEQQKKYNDTIGQRTQTEWDKARTTDDYKLSTDAEKKDILSKIQTKITAEVKQATLNDLGNTELAAKVKQPTGTTKSDLYSSNDAEYKKLQKDYDTKVKNGTYSGASKIKAETTLNKAKIGADYSKETRDYYGLSKAQLTDLVTKDTNGKKILDDVVAYGDALVNAGIQDYNKFKDKTGKVSLAKAKTSGGKKGSKKSSINYAAQLASINKLGSSNQSALRSLVRGTGKYNRKKVKA